MRDPLGMFLLRWRIRAVLPHVQGNLLDIGCGTNDLVGTFRSYGGNGTGVDVYQWGTVDCVVENSASLPFNDGEFDTVTIIGALNHIPNREEVLKEANRVLASNGKLILTMLSPHISKLWHKVRSQWDADQKERGMKEGELYGISRKDMHNLLDRTGFRVSYEHRFMFAINRLTVASIV